MAKNIQLSVAGLYLAVSLYFMLVFGWQHWDGWSFASLLPSALEHGLLWPVWLFAGVI